MCNPVVQEVICVEHLFLSSQLLVAAVVRFTRATSAMEDFPFLGSSQ